MISWVMLLKRVAIINLKLAVFFASIVLGGCASPQNLYSYIHDGGFDSSTFVAVIDHDGREHELVNLDGFWGVSKEARKVAQSDCEVRYKLTLITGSSFESQTMKLEFCEDGQGRAIRGGHRAGEFNFKSPEAYNFIESEFMKNKSLKN